MSIKKPYSSDAKSVVVTGCAPFALAVVATTLATATKATLSAAVGAPAAAGAAVECHGRRLYMEGQKS